MELDSFMPKYDADGNQTLIKTSTGIWSVTYNAENRPVRWEQGDVVVTMDFDRMGRRTFYKEMNGNTQVTFTRFIYKDYLCVRQVFSNSPYNTYKNFVWDPTETIATRPLKLQLPTMSLNLFYMHDGNKNVSDVVYRLTSNGIAAHYDYAPFGAVTRSISNAVPTADITTLNPFRFSSEYHDDTLGLVYYNYRHYNPTDGRWCGRDPVKESLSGNNQYQFCANKWGFIDLLGLLDSNLTGYTKRNFTTQLKAAFGVGGGISLNVIRESAQHCCLNNQLAEIVEWTVGGNIQASIGIGTTINVLGVGIDAEFIFSSINLEIADTHIVIDRCKNGISSYVNLLNLKINPGVKDVTFGLGYFMKMYASMSASIEFLLGANMTASEIDWFGGIYVDYDVSIGGAFLWREYSWLSSDDLQGKHTRITLVEF